jgi:hypothetical protein
LILPLAIATLDTDLPLGDQRGDEEKARCLTMVYTY